MTKKELVEALKYWPDETPVEVFIITDEDDQVDQDASAVKIIDVKIFLKESKQGKYSK